MSDASRQDQPAENPDRLRPTFHVDRFDLPAIRDAAISLATIGRKMPPADADEDQVGSWLLRVSYALLRLERLLNPEKLEFSDKRRTLFSGPDPAPDLRDLRGSVDRILRALQFEDMAHKAYSSGIPGKREVLVRPVADFPSAEGLDQIKPAEWGRIEEAARALPADPGDNLKDTDGEGVTIFDVAFAVESDDLAATQDVKGWVDSKRIKAKPIGKCPLDGRRRLYRLSEILDDVKEILALRPREIEKYRQTLTAKLRPPRPD